MFEAGINGSCKSFFFSKELQCKNAVSVASFLTTEATVTDIKEDKPAVPAMPDMGGMGMPGMM